MEKIIPFENISMGFGMRLGVPYTSFFIDGRTDVRTHPPTDYSTRNDPTCLNFGDCLLGVWKVYENCLEGIWRVSGGCLTGALRVSGRCLEGVWRVSMGCMNGNLVSEDW